MAEPPLRGKRALVIGAGSGIGRAVCDAFVDNGASVAALEVDAAKCERLAGEAPAIAVLAGDATSPSDNASAVALAVDRFGGLDVLVSCVGIFDFYRGLEELDVGEILPSFDELFHVNVASLLLGVKAALPPLKDSHGSVILTTSTSGFYPGRGGVLYVASKFAVRGLVISLAHELAPQVRVNGVAPGGTVGTDLRGPAALGLDRTRLDERAGRHDELKARTPLGVAMTPADHASSYVFLASDQARGMTGVFLHPDGGIGVKG
jgi:NAD(P)-dependent dehydrogenase (short-subunit alcohol dehydrogenase family)